jgi:hypothetical protein
MYGIMKKFLEHKFCKPGGCVFSDKLKMACARDLLYFELMDGTFVGFLITVQNFRRFALISLSPLTIHFFPKKSAFRMLN